MKTFKNRPPPTHFLELYEVKSIFIEFVVYKTWWLQFAVGFGLLSHLVYGGYTIHHARDARVESYNN